MDAKVPVEMLVEAYEQAPVEVLEAKALLEALVKALVEALVEALLEALVEALLEALVEVPA